MILKILDDDKNYHDNCSVSSAVLSASLSSRYRLPSVYDGGDGHQICMVVANILNKQQRTSDKGWFSSLSVGRVVNSTS